MHADPIILQVPPLLGVAADAYDNTAPAMIVPLCFFVAAWTYSLAVNFVPAYRIPADKFGETKIGIENVGQDEEWGSQSAGEKGVWEHAETPEIRTIVKA